MRPGRLTDAINPISFIGHQEKIMTDVVDDQKLTYAEKIDKLLRKAEATDSPEEAEALTAMAQKLMVKYAISEQLLAAARGLTEPDEVVEDTISFHGIFRAAYYELGAAVARANECKCLILSNHRTKDGTATTLYMVGFRSDVERAKLLITSLQLQCATALPIWWKQQDTGWMSGMDKFKARRDFIFGFANGVRSKLHEAKKQGTQEAVKEHAAATGETVETVSASTELVLRTRKERVQDWYDERYGKSTRTVRRNYSSSGTGARSAGYTAGRSANTGTTGLGGTRGAIGGR